MAAFYGKLDLAAFLDCLISMDDYFAWYSMSEANKLRFAIAKLKSTTRLWWGVVEERLARIGCPQIETCEEMKLKLETLSTLGL